ncbi:putative TetR family transcriptional regulator [Nocardia brasiliensis NBRC 14402]|uniref:TetR/AcrR family transcriptional regulator n=1 Tax=Nocardia brasiliensis TaxID=37326 RepID=UPI0002D4F17C|nr:TetR/AcrR family transcriptional regulator [Nocardia brasiliensis]ASF12915.1 TetR/AcrR family transcriptional regulator [Nocardia brasiliensis]GAJ80920.1 putative TetR family transcriptional regulator [Nocardia brasiliensis NBRC 14402]SUB54305.1 HTH-type transcriptional repressor KstR2 [Nocardia brasiliensis]
MTAETTRSSPAAERILRTAAELIAVRGFAATSTRDIAAAVGVRQPAIYKHFAAKDDILAALVRLGLERPLALADELAALDAPAVVKLHRWLREALDHLQRSPYVLASILTTQELTRERFTAELGLVTRLDRIVIDLVTAGQREGDVRAMDPVSGARLVQALFDALALPEIAVSPAEIVEFALTGLLADPARLPEIRRAAQALPLS